MERDEHGHFKKGIGGMSGERSLTGAERDARNVKKLTLMDALDQFILSPQHELDSKWQDPSTIALDKIALNLIRVACGQTMEPSIGAIKIVLDRTCGPVKQKVELSGNIYDLASMTKEQKIELLNELKKQRQSTE